MKFFLLDQDNSSQEVWHNCAEAAGIAFQLIRYNDYCLDLPQEAGIVVVDKSVCNQDFIGQIERLCRRNRRQQVISTGESLSVNQAVDLMRVGVAAALEKPFDVVRLKVILPAIVRLAIDTIQSESEYHRLDNLFNSLTARERQVLDMVLNGVHNRDSAIQLGVSVRTVEARRAKVYRKLECNGLAELVRKIERLAQLKNIFLAQQDPVTEVSSFGKHHLDRPAIDTTKSEGI